MNVINESAKTAPALAISQIQAFMAAKQKSDFAAIKAACPATAAMKDGELHQACIDAGYRVEP